MFDVETERLRSGVPKLARGHVAYELNDPRTDEPGVRPLPTMSAEEIELFEDRPKPGEIELGSGPRSAVA